MERNRIEYWRKKRGLSGAQLARMIGTSQPTFFRIENGIVKLTVDWMRKLADALEISPVDLLPLALVADVTDELEPTPLSTNAEANGLMASKGLTAYVVKKSRVTRAGINDGDVVVADGSPPALSTLQNGAIVVVTITLPDEQPTLGLRQYIAPSLVMTNHDGRNTILDTTDDSIPVEVIGVVHRYAPTSAGK